MFSAKTIIIIVGILLTAILIYRKLKGLEGSWDTKENIEEFVYFESEFKDIKNKENTVSVQTQNNDSIGEKICRKYLEKKFGKVFSKERPGFLKNPKTSSCLELDCFNRELNLALEYNGKQHYDFVPKFHKSRYDFIQQKYRDEIKQRLCYKNGINLIVVPYTVANNNIPKYIETELSKLGY